MKSTDIVATLQKAADGLLFVSETEAELTAFAWDGAAELDDAEVRRRSGLEADAPVEQTTLDRFFRAVSGEERPKFDRLARALKRFLRDVRVYKVGDVTKDVFIVGRVPGGAWAGLRTSVVET